MIFETHAHYDDESFDGDREETLARVREAGVYPIINVGASIESTKTTLELAKKHEDIYAAVGVHPSEIGLDYHWDKEPGVQKLQRGWFGRQLLLAKEVRLPVIIHSRDAAEDTVRIMKENGAQEIPGVIHCYSYSPELAQEFVKMGYYIGVGGVVTFKNAKKLVRTVEQVPLSRILLETDCPYMAPEPHRGERNDSSNIPYVIARIAELKGVSKEEVERVTEENAYRLFTRVRAKG